MNQDTITLYFKEGSSDKVYHASIVQSNGNFNVEYAFGRRGSMLSTGKKNATPVPYDDAKKIFDKLVKEKMAKGYTPGEDGTPYRHTDLEQRETGIRCQLPNPISEQELDAYFSDPGWWMQEKKNGKHLLVLKDGQKVVGINKKGLSVGIPETIHTQSLTIKENLIIDGEAIGDRIFAHDLLLLSGQDLRCMKFKERLLILEQLIQKLPGNTFSIIETAKTRSEKIHLFDRLKSDKKEGVVFKNSDATYAAGRPTVGGNLLKFKFYETASFIVTKIHNDRRSVAIGLNHEGQLTSSGNVTLPLNRAIPEIGDVVEVRYLYAFKESGSLHQPVFLGVRDDIDAKECTTKQLKYYVSDDI